jgi:hypothetical protein
MYWLQKNLLKVRFVGFCHKIHTIHLFLVPYRACRAFKNVRNSQGKVTKTICATELNAMHITNKRNCESFNMKIAGFDTLKLEPEFYELANTRYNTSVPRYIFVAGFLSINYCRCIGNQKTGVANNYTDDQCFCTDLSPAFCEFRYPRGNQSN